MRKFLLLLAGGSLAVAQQYSIKTVAGGAPPATPAAAASTGIGQTRRVTLDKAGNLYFSAGNSVFKMNAGGTLTLVAGNSRAGFSGDGGPAVNAQLNGPQGLAFDGGGNLYIADSLNNRVRLVTTDGLIHTFAGNGTVSVGGGPGAYGDGGAATDAQLHLPLGVAVDSPGNVYIADTGDNTIRIVTTDGLINRFAGDSYPGFYNDGMAATSSEVHTPSDVAVDFAGNVYIADTANGYLRRVTPDGLIHVIAGNGTIGYSGDGGLATSADLTAPMAVAVDSSGNIFFVENGDSRIREVDTKGNINTVAGNGTPGFGGDGSNPTGAQLNFPTGIAVDSSGNLYVADSFNLRIRKIAGNSISTVAGNGLLSYSGDNGPALKAQLNAPQGVAIDKAGNLYVADTGNNAARAVSPGGTITGLAGNGTAGSSGNQLNAPQGVVADAAGNVYIADTLNARVQKAAGGSVSTLAGGSTFYTPIGGAVDAAGNVYVADLNSNVVRQISAGGSVSTVAGNGTAGYSGDGGAATGAQLNSPQGVAVDTAGNLYIADTGNHVVRKVANGQITTIGGNGLSGFSGDAGPALQAQIGSPAGIAVDASGNVYVSDGSLRVRKIFPSGFITTIAGSGSAGYSGDGGPAMLAQLNQPTALAVDAAGNVYVTDTGNNAVRVLQPSSSGISISSVANGASNLAEPIAPGEVITIYGSGLGPSGLTQFQLSAIGRVPTNVAGTSVFVNGTPAPVLYTSATQVGAVVPFFATASPAQVVVSYQGQVTPPVSQNLVAVSPGLFQSGAGQVLAINQDGSVNDANHPAKAGTYVTMYATGFGQTNPNGQDGALSAVPLTLPAFPVTVSMGGQQATVQYDGAAPGLVQGVMQVNVLVPSGLTAGAVPIVLNIGGVNTQNGLSIYVGN